MARMVVDRRRALGEAAESDCRVTSTMEHETAPPSGSRGAVTWRENRRLLTVGARACISSARAEAPFFGRLEWMLLGKSPESAFVRKAEGGKGPSRRERPLVKTRASRARALGCS